MREPRRRNPLAADGLLLGLFFASGATSLVYETLWVRQLHLVLGTSQLAVSTVLAAFMGGLAAGGFAAARWARRFRNSLAAYAACEGFIGAYALAFPALEGVGARLFAGWIQHAGLGLLTRASGQLLVAVLLLLPPTLCMGATLPLLIRAAVAGSTPVGPAVGRLYGANTIGAVAGAGLAGFVLLPSIGLAATTRWAAAANGVLALAAAVVAAARSRGGNLDAPAGPRARGRPKRSAGSPRPPSKAALAASPPTASASATSEPGADWRWLAIAAFAGFTGLLYEVAWFRLMTLLLGGSAYAFSIMLLAFLLGIGVGGLFGGRALHRRAAATDSAGGGLARLQLGIATLSWAAMWAYGRLPGAWVKLYELVEGRWLLIWGSQLLIALAIMTPPAVLMGASFPYLAQLAGERSRDPERAVGLVYGANTLGAIAGAVMGALLVLPSLHVRGAVLLAASVNVVVAAAVSLLSRPPGRRAARATLALAATAGLAVAAAWRWPPPWDPLLMSSGVYQYVRQIVSGRRQGLLVDPHSVLLFYDEGLTSVVTVGEDSDTGNRWLANNGKIDASTHGDLKTQVLLGQLGFAARPDAERVLIVGLASGITAGSVTLRPGPRSIDLVEIEPVIVAASHFFDEYNHHPLADPRVRLVLDDARSHLARSADGYYDLAVSEPSNPWLSGVSNLFTEEFFELGKRKLSQSGVWVQWLHCYEMAPDDLRSLLATFADVFPEVALFRVDASDLILLGSREPLHLEAAAIRSSLASAPQASAELAKVGIAAPEDVLAHYLFGRYALAALTGDVERNTDDNMRIEYSAPLHLYEDTTTANDALLLSHAELPIQAVEGVVGLFALANGYANLGLEQRASDALAAAHQLALSEPPLER